MSRSVTRKRHWVLAGASIAVLAGIGVWLMGPKTTTDIAVPELAHSQLDAVADTHVLFGHQSVGSNILDGVANVYADAGVTAPVVVDVAEAATSSPSIAHAYVGVNGDPSGKFAAFRELVNGAHGEFADVALVKLCYTDVTASTDVAAVFAEYSVMMSELESRHPEITFVYSTVPLTTDRSWKSNIKALLGRDDQMGSADNLARAQYNAFVRAEYASSGLLFDIAAVEATMSTDPAVRTLDGADYHVLNSALSADAGHLNDVGGRVAAAELVRIIADIRS